MQTKESVDVALLRQRCDQRIVWILVLIALFQLSCGLVIGLPVYRKFQVVDEVVVSRIYPRRVIQLFKLLRKGFVQFFRMPTVVAVACARIKQGVAAEQGGLIRVR